MSFCIFRQTYYQFPRRESLRLHCHVRSRKNNDLVLYFIKANWVHYIFTTTVSGLQVWEKWKFLQNIQSNTYKGFFIPLKKWCVLLLVFIKWLEYSTAFFNRSLSVINLGCYGAQISYHSVSWVDLTHKFKKVIKQIPFMKGKLYAVYESH